MKCGQLSLPHKSPWLRFCAQTFHFLPPSPSSIVWRREASLIMNFWPAVCRKLKMFGRAGSTQTFITRDSELGYMREEREKNNSKTFIFLQPCCTRSVGDSTFPDTLKILGKSHMSQRRHSNNLRTIMHLSLIMQMRQGSRPVVCWHTVNAE